MEDLFAELDDVETQSTSSASTHASKKAKKASSGSSFAVLETINQNRDARHKEKMAVLQDLVKSSVDKQPTQPDSVDLFMQSIAETVKEFPKNKISMVKMKFLEIVSAVEEQIAAEQTTVIRLVQHDSGDNTFHIVSETVDTDNTQINIA